MKKIGKKASTLALERPIDWIIAIIVLVIVSGLIYFLWNKLMNWIGFIRSFV